MQYVECPEECSGAGKDILLFLAGGITNCPDWQSHMVELLKDTPLVLLNPRRKNWGTADGTKTPREMKLIHQNNLEKAIESYKDDEKSKTARENAQRTLETVEQRLSYLDRRLKELTLPVAQIEWEYLHLLRADAVLFWFPAETLCPITLYELGNWSFRPKKLFLGCAEGYARTLDVQVQVRLQRPRQTVHSSLESLAGEVREWAASKSENYFFPADDQIKPTEYNLAGVSDEHEAGDNNQT